MNWEEADYKLVESDVIEWTEAIWPPKQPYRRRKKKNTYKPKPIGEQKVIGQITEIDGDFIKLNVLKAEILKNDTPRPIEPHAKGTTLIKKRATILRGNPQRLHWSEEDVRRALVEAID